MRVHDAAQDSARALQHVAITALQHECSQANRCRGKCWIQLQGTQKRACRARGRIALGQFGQALTQYEAVENTAGRWHSYAWTGAKRQTERVMRGGAAGLAVCKEVQRLAGFIYIPVLLGQLV